MPKIIDYPRCSMKNALELAYAVEDLGGAAAAEIAAEKLKKKMGGAFKAQVGGAAKFGLVSSSKGTLRTTELYKKIRLAYTAEEEAAHLRQAFLHPQLFAELFEKYRGKKLPVDLLDRILIREFDVPSNIAGRIGGYFVDAARRVDLLGADNLLKDFTSSDIDTDAGDEDEGADDQDGREAKKEPSESTFSAAPPNTADFSVTIRGPGMNSTISIHEDADLVIVDAMLAKVRSKLARLSDEESG